MHIYKMNINIDSMNKYFLNNENIYYIIEKMNRYKNKSNKKTIVKNKNINKTKNIFDYFFVPSSLYQDSLFWCWYILSQGITSYSFAENFTYKTKKDTIMTLIEPLRKEKKFLYTKKIKICDIESNLLYDEYININTFRAILLIHSYNLIYITDKLYFEDISFLDNKTCIIYEKNDKFGIYISDDDLDLLDIKSKRIIIQNLHKPISAISNYKVNELKDMCKILNIDIMKTPTKSKTKKELYELLLQEF